MGVQDPFPALTKVHLCCERHAMATADSTPSKTCRKCGIVKPLTEYQRDHRNPDGLFGGCKQCNAEQQKETTRKRRAARAAAKEARRIEARATTAHCDDPNVITPVTKILDDVGRDWAWAFAVFKPLFGDENVVIGSNGTVWNSRSSPLYPPGWHPVKVFPSNRRGYPTFHLLRNGKWGNIHLHAAVALTFIGPRPKGMDCCHNDGNLKNSDLRNLRWGTRQSNMDDQIRHGTRRRGAMVSNAIMTDAKVLELRRLHRQGVSHSDLMQRFNISQPAVSQIINHRRWTHLP
jgi:hypothetical protein